MTEQTQLRDLQISGDTLALDQSVRAHLRREASSLQGCYPGLSMRLRVTIAEEFDQRFGHRVRCELVAAAGASRQVVIREAQKDPLAAIAGAFAAAKRQLRRLARSRPRLQITGSPGLQPSQA